MTSNQQPKDLADLQRILEEETKTYASVEQKMQDKKRLLINGDALGLSQLDQELIVLSQRAAKLEQERIVLMLQMGHEKKTLGEMIGELNPADAKPLMEARDRMSRILENVRQINLSNQALLNLSLQWIADTVEIITTALAPEGASYTASGRQKASTLPPQLEGRSTIEHSA